MSVAYVFFANATTENKPDKIVNKSHEEHFCDKNTS